MPFYLFNNKIVDLQYLVYFMKKCFIRHIGKYKFVVRKFSVWRSNWLHVSFFFLSQYFICAQGFFSRMEFFVQKYKSSGEQSKPPPNLIPKTLQRTQSVHAEAFQSDELLQDCCFSLYSNNIHMTSLIPPWKSLLFQDSKTVRIKTYTVFKTTGILPFPTNELKWEQYCHQ